MFRKELWVGYKTLVTRDMQRYLFRIWVQTFVPPVITSVLYFLIFGKVVGARMGSLNGLPYILYIVPGLILMPLVNNAYANGSFIVFSAKIQRYIELLLFSPLPEWVILAGFVSSSLLRGVIVGLMVFIVSLFFVHFTVAHIFLSLLLVVLSSALFSVLGIINGIVAKSFDTISIIPTFVLTPLTYLGGVFYSVSLLPRWAQIVSHFNPIFYMINVFKYTLLNIHVQSVWGAMLLLLVLDVILFFLALSMLRNNQGLRP